MPTPELQMHCTDLCSKTACWLLSHCKKPHNYLHGFSTATCEESPSHQRCCKSHIYGCTLAGCTKGCLYLEVKKQALELHSINPFHRPNRQKQKSFTGIITSNNSVTRKETAIRTSSQVDHNDCCFCVSRSHIEKNPNKKRSVHHDVSVHNTSFFCIFFTPLIQAPTTSRQLLIHQGHKS